MLNLLFITDSPKAEFIKSGLQPVLKVIIDVVTDFDHGLKDVFEKRPATVCIQDQIGGVTGESVARHIQMLLGSSAPTFILLHSGNSKARAIKGLYEHLVDLSQSNDTLIENIRNTLKSLLGDQWEKVFIPPKQTPAAVMSSVAVPEESREDADKLVDDFLSDLETSGFSVIDEPPPALDAAAAVPPPVREETEAADLKAAEEKSCPPETEAKSGTAETAVFHSASDEMAAMLRDEVEKAIHDENMSKPPVPPPIEPDVVFKIMPTPVPENPSPAAVADVSASGAVPSAHVVTKEPAASGAAGKDVKGEVLPASRRQTPAVQKAEVSVPPPAEEFRVRRGTPHVEEQIPEDLLLAFEENYRSESTFVRRSVVLVLICVLCAAGGWYYLAKNPQLISSLKQRVMPASAVREAAAPAPVQAPAPVPSPEAERPLPAFIPKEGHDRAYSSGRPGWERYVGRNNEYRIFKTSGRIQAVQVLALKKTPVPASVITSVLKELTGSSEYLITSRDTKAGVRVESGEVRNKGEIKIYRKNGAVRGFVVSIN